MLHMPGQECWAIEIKRTTVPKVERRFYQGCKDLNPTRRFVVYSGEERFPLSRQVEAIPLLDLTVELRNFS
ncbi:hypothetical protein [Coxiella endosymbiont of Ornithodoros maritimus]|uniref:hypothetical protein n=1 Tax=Coxiella endosymbiont of Ornithodoros maritimus TaxID=1656172 RepID=UPI002264D0AE|nr:hypothetical protein [Coxiella endosymbiont of Ornithodoros maritimus]